MQLLLEPDDKRAQGAALADINVAIKSIRHTVLKLDTARYIVIVGSDKSPWP
jgi:hypothetical protein